jgi:CO/xanthine dehydrogenase Mo-binding subunit
MGKARDAAGPAEAGFASAALCGVSGEDVFVAATALTCGTGVHAVELEVDPATGGVKLLNYVVVNDCGRVINPMTPKARSTAARCTASATRCSSG